MTQAQIAKFLEGYIQILEDEDTARRTIWANHLNNMELEDKGQKRKADAMDDSAGSDSDDSDREDAVDVIYRTVKCPHCKRYAFKFIKFSFKLIVLVIAQLISNYLLCNQLGLQ